MYETLSISDLQLIKDKFPEAKIVIHHPLIIYNEVVDGAINNFPVMDDFVNSDGSQRYFGIHRHPIIFK